MAITDLNALKASAAAGDESKLDAQKFATVIKAASSRLQDRAQEPALVLDGQDGPRRLRQREGRLRRRREASTAPASST